MRDIIDDVRERGDAALRDLTAALRRLPHRRPARAARRARRPRCSAPSPTFRAALEYAAAGSARYHELQVAAGAAPRTRATASTFEEITRPVDRAGLYVPGGRASYPSTVLMTAIPAAVAGVPEIALCVPPAPDGRVPDVTLAAAALVGVDEVYRVGGAQAIAALAYGTETIRPVDVIVGPGNMYVAAAKREVAGVVGIESLAGPVGARRRRRRDARPPSSSPPTSWPRPSTAPAAPRSSSPGTSTSPTRSTPRSSSCSAEARTPCRDRGDARRPAVAR